jgi:hypothetical protein
MVGLLHDAGCEEAEGKCRVCARQFDEVDEYVLGSVGAGKCNLSM